MATPLPPKREVLVALLEQSSVYVHLDPRADGVRVPAWFKRQPQLVLQIGLNMPVPIMDLGIDDDAVSCTLSFSRSPHFCYVPWDAVFALVGEDQRGMVWPRDIPPEVAAQKADDKQARQKKLRAVAGDDGGSASPKEELRAKSEPRRDPTPEPAPEQPEVRAIEETAAAKAAPASKPPSKRKLPPYLRVVK